LSIILCTQHKGGVGKTTLAVHFAGILISQLNRILLIDCDTQSNAWLFYFGDKPQAPLEIREYSNRLSIVWNPQREPIRRLADIESYDHVIFDMSTPLPDTVQVIAANHPDKIFIPVSPNPWAVEALSDNLPVIAALEEQSLVQPEITIVPLGSSKKEIDDKIKIINEVPKRYKVARRMRYLAKETDQALREGDFIWNYQKLEDVRDYFVSLLKL
jgi:chromosome partitioning protein